MSFGFDMNHSNKTSVEKHLYNSFCKPKPTPKQKRHNTVCCLEKNDLQHNPIAKLLKSFLRISQHCT